MELNFYQEVGLEILSLLIVVFIFCILPCLIIKWCLKLLCKKQEKKVSINFTSPSELVVITVEPQNNMGDEHQCEMTDGSFDCGLFDCGIFDCGSIDCASFDFGSLDFG